MSIFVVNKSTLIEHRDAQSMVHAVNTQVRDHLSPAWGLHPQHVQLIDHEGDAPIGSWVIGLLDDSDQAGVLGWHTEESGVVYGRVFARPSLDAGSTPLTGPYAISSVLSHEVCETLVDPTISTWWQVNDTCLVAAEVCDPVEDLTYTVTYEGRPIEVSDFVLPTWADPNAAPGVARDYLLRVHDLYKVTPGGYAVLWDVAKNHVGNVYGEQFPEWKLELKEAETARNARRRQQHPA